MKDTEFTEVVKGVDLNTAEGRTKLFNAFNNYESSQTKRKENLYETQIGELQAANIKMKEDLNNLTNTNSELKKQNTLLTGDNSSLRSKNFVYQNINPKMDDGAYADFDAIVKARMYANPSLKYEDVAMDVAKSRNFMATGSVANVTPSAPAPVVSPQVAQPAPAVKPTPTGFNFNGPTAFSSGIDTTDNSSKAQRARFMSLCSGKKRS